MVTTCMLTRFIRSTNGISMVRPGRRTSGWARPSRNTTPRSICWTTRALDAQAARPSDDQRHQRVQHDVHDDLRGRGEPPFERTPVRQGILALRTGGR